MHGRAKAVRLRRGEAEDVRTQGVCADWQRQVFAALRKEFPAGVIARLKVWRTCMISV